MHSEHTGLEDAQLSSQRLGTIKSLALDATAFTAMLQKHARQEELGDEMGEERSGAYSTLNSARSSNRSMSPPPPQSTPSKNVANGRKPLTQSGAEVAVAVHPLAFGALREAKRGVKSHQTKSSLGSHAGGASSQHARPPLAHGAGGTHPASRTVSPHPPVLNAEKKNTGTSLTPMIPSIASDPTEVECEIGDVPPISQVCLVRAPHRRTEEDSSGCVSNMWLEDILRALPNDVSALHELVRALVKTIRNLEASHATRALHHASYVLDLAQDSAPKQGLPPGGGTILPEPLYHNAHNRRNPSDPRSCPFGVLEKEKAQKNRVVGRKSTSVVPPNLSVKAKSQRVANTTSPLKKRRVDSVDNVAQSRVSNGGTMTHSRTPTRNVPLTPTANRATSPATSTRSSASSSAGGGCIRAGGRHVIITSAEASPSTMAPMRSTNSPLFTPTVVPPLAMLPSGTSVDARGSPSSKEQSQCSSNSSGRVYTTSSKGQRSSSGRPGAPSAPDPTRFLLRGGGIRNQRIVSACGTDREGRNQGGGTHRSVTQNSNGVQQQPIPRSPHLSTIAPPKSYLSDTMAQNSTLSGGSPTVHHITTVTRHYDVSSPLLSGRVAPCEEGGVRSGRTTPSSRSSKQTSVVRVNTSVQAAARISPVTKRIITSSNRPSGETFRRTAVTPTGCRATDIPGQEGPDGNAVQDFRVHSQSPHDTNPGGTKDNNNTILGVPRTQGQHTASVTTTRNGQAVRSPSGNQKASMNGPVIVKVRGNPVEESSEKQQDDESSSVSNTSHNWRSSSLTGLSSQSPPRGEDRGSVVSALMREDATIRSSSTTTRSVKKSTEHRVQLRRQGTNVITATPLSALHAHSRLNSGWEGQKPEGTRQS